MRSDEELMAAYMAGDTSAFHELFRRYAPILQRVLARGLNGREESDDLVQQTFLHLHRARNDFKPGARVRPWLFTIALNLKREHFRRVKRRPEAPLELDGRLDPSVGPQGHARSDAASTLKAALQQIPPDQAEVIALHWLDGLSFPEVAEVVGATLSAVKVRAHRGYAAMRAYLDRDVGNPGSKSGIEP
ncbi:MAG: RNA polymerase sigma factor [Myxococcales bacterium]|nr:RNA polymerase sigma factor [Myxococcales bacterium]MCB9582457.1 RNA polymerase sigma factor [Polyangiaceae bacterium]